MEKKYYFRGLGLGIIVTAIIMGITVSGGTKTREMTDDEVIARAKELGMIEDSRLLEPTEEEPDREDAASQETPVRKDIAVKAEAEAAAGKNTEAEVSSSGIKTEAGMGTKSMVDTPEPVQITSSASSTETKPRADTNEMTKQDDGRNPEPSGSAISITIASGDSSYTVAKKLEAAGIVSSASSYDTYLCERGYDKKLRTGTYQIPPGANDEQIAGIVTGQQ